MKLRSTMPLTRNDATLNVTITGLYEPPQHGRPESVAGIEAFDYDGPLCLTEAEWSDAEEILLKSAEKPYED